MRHAKSFQHAFSGLFHALMNEPNFRVEVVAALFFVSVGLMVKLSLTHWALLVLAIGFVLVAEVINTVIEEFIDLLVKEHHDGVKVIKDMAAAFVLIASLTCLFVFIIVIVGYIVP